MNATSPDKLVVAPKALAGFRRRALKAFPKEYLEALWGRRSPNGTITILETREVAHLATKVECWPLESVSFGEKDGRMVRLGSVHSHPQCSESSPSVADYEAAQGDNELVIGIYAIIKTPGKRSWTRLQFYNATAAYQVRFASCYSWE